MNRKIVIINKWMMLFVLFCGYFLSAPLTTSASTNSSDDQNISDHTLQQQIEVSGTVTDAQSGNPLPGVNIIVQGTTTGTTTDMDGNYTIDAPADATLVFSFVGYQEKTVQISGQEQINVSLEQAVTELEEVVAIGYGTAKRSEVTGSVGVATNEDLEQQPSVNALQSLRGKMAGVSIYGNSGAPGGGNRVLIRGMGTINANTDPLYVVDGVQKESIEYLNPNDIESIEVLKDASSAAIYGARGANGVVLITTQKGLEEEGVQVTYKSDFSVSWLAKKNNEMYTPMNSEEFMEVQRRGFENATYFGDYEEGEAPELVLNNDRLFDENGNPRYDTDWEDEATRAPFSHQHHLSIQSGSENSSTGLFLNYTNQDGIYLNSYMNRASAKFTYDADPFDWVTFSTNLRVNRIWENSPYTEGGGVSATTRAIHEIPPIFPVKWPDGSWSNSSQTEGTTLGFEDGANPVSSLLAPDFLHDRTHLLGNAYLEFHITPHLDLRTQVGLNNRMHKYRNYEPTYLHDFGYPEGEAQRSNETNTFWQNENYLSYDQQFGAHHIKATAGASWQQHVNDYGWFNARQFATDFYKYHNMNVSEEYDHPSSNYWDWTMNSYFARGTYTYDDKYTITLTGRVDGSSRFGEDNKYGFFPSGGFSWLVSEENFMSNVDVIDRLRFRTSYGVTGNTEIGLYNSLATISSGTTLINGELQSSSSVARLANPELEWEKTHQADVGLEVGAFDNAISLELDYYYKLTTDLLLNRPIPATTGFTSMTDNIGEVLNRGVDVKLTTRNIRSSDFNWSTTFTVNYNKNTVEQLGAQNEDMFPGPWWLAGSQTILRVGEPVNSFWGYIRKGTWNLDEAEEAAEVNKLPGMKKYSDEKQILGKGFPDYRGSFINRFQLGNFDLMVDLQFSYGAEILQQFLHSSEDRQGLMNGLKTQLYNAWTPDNQNTMNNKIRHANYSGQGTMPDSHWVVDGSYLRGNLFTLGYTFSDDALNNLGVGSLRVHATLENAFVIHSDEFKGYDPESNGQWDASNFGQNMFFYQYPKARSFSIGINAQF